MQESKERNDVSSSPCYEQSKVASNVNRIDNRLNLYIQFLTLQEKKKVKINFRHEVINNIYDNREIGCISFNKRLLWCGILSPVPPAAAIAILAIGPPDQ